MTPVKTISGKAYPFGLKNVDTDIIIPAHWLKTISRTGLGKGAFEALRKEPGNVFDSAEYAGSPILIAGDNFGWGDARYGDHCGDRAVLFGHFFQQCFQEWIACCGLAAGGD
jgi:3-isopropylmalate dehydratase small subunit